MTYKSDEDIADLAIAMIGCILPKDAWTHAAHFASALWLLRSSDHDAYRDMPGFIRRYNESVGVVNSDTEGYHETITIASLKAAEHFLKSSESDLALYEICNGLLASYYGRPDWILDYWSKDVLFSVKARKIWVAPDLQNLTF